MGAHRRHPRTATNEDHLCIGFFREELTVRTKNGDLVARLQ